MSDFIVFLLVCVPCFLVAVLGGLYYCHLHPYFEMPEVINLICGYHGKILLPRKTVFSRKRWKNAPVYDDQDVRYYNYHTEYLHQNLKREKFYVGKLRGKSIVMVEDDKREFTIMLETPTFTHYLLLSSNDNYIECAIPLNWLLARRLATGKVCQVKIDNRKVKIKAINKQN